MFSINTPRLKILFMVVVCGIAGFAFVLAALIFAKPVFAATWTASGECNFGDFYSESASKTFVDEASCRAYVARGTGICRDYTDIDFVFKFTLIEDCHQVGCNTGYWSFNEKCITKDQWCEATYGPNIHGEGDQCSCDSGYSFIDGRCITKDEGCQVKYGANIHEKNGKCSCDTGYSFLNNACVSIDQYCRATYGENAYEKDDSCYCRTGYVFNEKKVCVPESASPQPTNNADKKFLPPTNPEPPRKISEEEKAMILEWLRSRGFGPEDIKKIDDADMWHFITSPLFEELRKGKTNAEEKYKKADSALSQALADGSIGDLVTLENIRKMFLDAWFDSPQDKKTNLMMAMLERERGHDSTSDIFYKFAYAGLNKPERAAISSGIENAKIITYADIFNSMEREKRQQEVERTWQEQALQKSSFMNRMKDEINNDITSAQKATKEICKSIGPCDWTYAKKVEIVTKAENLSQKVRDLMDDPIKAVFNIDRKKIKKDLGIK